MVDKSFGINDREQEYLKVKSQPRNEKYAHGSVGARVILMVRRGILLVIGVKGIECNCADDLCGCGT